VRDELREEVLVFELYKKALYKKRAFSRGVSRKNTKNLN
jgi:hypothetical protein